MKYHTVNITSYDPQKDHKLNRYFTADIDGISVGGYFKLVNQYRTDANYRFHFPSNNLIMKHEDWRQIRKLLLTQINYKHQYELDTAALRKKEEITMPIDNH